MEAGIQSASRTQRFAQAALTLASFGLAAEAMRRMAVNPATPDWSDFAVLLLLACVASRMRFRLPGLERPVNLAFPFCFAAIAEQPPLYALGLVAAVEAFDFLLTPRAETSRGARAIELAFHLAVVALSVFAAATVYRGLGPEDGMSWAVAAVASALAYFAVSTTLHAVRIALVEGVNPIRAWNERFFWTSPLYLLAPLGVLVSQLLLNAESALDTVIGVSIIGAAYWYLRVYFPRLNEEQDQAQRLADIRQRALETLAVAIEAKDGSTAGHLRRVKSLAVQMGRRLGCDREQIRTLQLAAVLHDVGKVGVADYILKKPSRLTDREFKEIAAHASIGAKIVSTMDFPEPVDEIVLCHHEHWDGSGYPRGVSGEAIPREARILTVVDCFDALVSRRPYRDALPVEAALEIMERQRGKIFDPEILDAFLELLPDVVDDLKEQLAAETHESLEDAPVDIRQTWMEHDEVELSERTLALQRLGRRPEYMEALHQCLEVLGADLDFEHSFRTTLHMLAAVTGAHSVSVWIRRPRQEHWSLYIERGLSTETEPVWTLEDELPPAGAAIRAEKPIIGPGALSAESREFAAAGSTLAAPLSIGDSLEGLLLICSDHANAFDEEHALLIELLGPKFAASLQAARRLKQLRLEAHQDPITLLPNVTASGKRLREEINRASRQELTFGLLYMDLNGLKPVNDSYGHEAGNRLLRAVGERLRGAVRNYDFVGRVGGDEFLAILPGILREDLEEIVMHIKAAMAETTVEVGREQFVRPVVSVGAVLYPEDGVEERELMDLGDQRMYEDKRRSLASPLDSASPLPPALAKKAGAARAG